MTRVFTSSLTKVLTPAVGLFALAMFLTAALTPDLTGLAQAQDVTDPSRVPIPVVYASDPSMSVVAGLTFSSRTGVTLAKAPTIVESRARGQAGEAELLRIDAYDHRGDLIADYNSWHPMWTINYDDRGEEQLTILEGQTGEILIPFSPNLATLAIADVALDQQVFEVDLDDTFIEFCQSNPSHEACITDLAVIGSGDPATAAPGDPVTYTVDVENNGPNPARLFKVVNTLPDGVSFVSSKNGICVENPAGTLTCEIDEALAVGESISLTINVVVDSDIEVAEGSQVSLVNTAQVELLAGSDKNSANNIALIETLVTP